MGHSNKIAILLILAVILGLRPAPTSHDTDIENSERILKKSATEKRIRRIIQSTNPAIKPAPRMTQQDEEFSPLFRRKIILEEKQKRKELREKQRSEFSKNFSSPQLHHNGEILLWTPEWVAIKNNKNKRLKIQRRNGQGPAGLPVFYSLNADRPKIASGKFLIKAKDSSIDTLARKHKLELLHKMPETELFVLSPMDDEQFFEKFTYLKQDQDIESVEIDFIDKGVRTE